MGEDVGEPVEPPMKKKKSDYYRPKRVLADGTVTQSTPGVRKYAARRIKVTDPRVLAVLNDLYDKMDSLKRNAGVGHEYDGVRYAQYYGRLNKAGDIGRLKTYFLSSEQKVYQLDGRGNHAEVKWQNDRNNKNRAYGNIQLTGEGGGYDCSIAGPFKTELTIFI